MGSRKLVAVIGATSMGKTSLCAQSGFTFIKTDVSGVWKDYGLDPKEEMPLSHRLEVQTSILEEHVRQWQAAFDKYADKNVIFLTDRSPICFMTYTLAEISGYMMLSEENQKAVEEYIRACVQALKMFDGIFHLRGIPFDTSLEDGKVRATTNPVYHAHYQSLSIGLMLNAADQLDLPWTICDTTLMGVRVTDLRTFVGSL